MSRLDRRSGDRRVGERVHAALPIEVTLTMGESVVVVTALIVDVSVSGCRVCAPLSPDVLVGREVRLNADGREASGVIRRTEVGGIPGKSFFGMEFAYLDDGFRALLFRTIADGLRAVPSASSSVKD